MTNGIIEQVENMEDFGEQEIRDYELELSIIQGEDEEEIEFCDDYDDDSDFEDLD